MKNQYEGKISMKERSNSEQTTISSPHSKLHMTHHDNFSTEHGKSPLGDSSTIPTRPPLTTGTYISPDGTRIKFNEYIHPPPSEPTRDPTHPLIWESTTPNNRYRYY